MKLDSHCPAMLALQLRVCCRGWGTGVQYFVELQTPVQVEWRYCARQTTQVLSIPVPDHLVEVVQLMVDGIVAMLVSEAALDSEWLGVMGTVPVAGSVQGSGVELGSEDDMEVGWVGTGMEPGQVGSDVDMELGQVWNAVLEMTGVELVGAMAMVPVAMSMFEAAPNPTPSLQ